MTTKKKTSEAKSKTTAKKIITDKKLGAILTETLNQVAEEPIAEQVTETSVENSEPIVETPTEPVKPAKQSKISRMVELLQTPQGIPLKELAEKLSWLENSVRGAMSLYAKNHPEYALVTEKVDGVRTYRLTKNGD
ncbi:MAG: DUF3489 domain-containing protein [Alphaproteobacteria bacterium]|nr:DUF3489 domain-containing protein [Alphaproteobacteria bacterium]